jgi:NTP pyrophosphatase (non-canonical NTP hydrolase)
MLNKSTYLLICLIEECAEVIQRACKAIRFGLDEVQPGQHLNNHDRISEELSDVQGVTVMLEVECDIKVLHFDDIAIQNKIAKIRKYMPLSVERGMLEPATAAEGR